MFSSNSAFILLFLLGISINLSLATSSNRRCDAVKCYKSSSPLNGNIAAAFTPFDKYGNLDVTVIKEYAQYLVRKGMQGVLVAPINSGGASLTVAERKKLLDAWVIEAKKCDLTVILQIGTNIVYSQMKELAAYAKLKNVAAVVVTTAGISPNNTETVVKFAEGIAKACNPVPVLIYKAPEDAYDLNYYLVAKLAFKRIRNFVGLILDFISALGVHYSFPPGSRPVIIVDDEYPTASTYEACFNGTSTIYKNVFPEMELEILEAVERGDFSTANKISRTKNEIIASCLKSLNDQVIRKDQLTYYDVLMRLLFMKLTGINVGYVPFPGPQVSASIKQQCLDNVQEKGIQFKN